MKKLIIFMLCIIISLSSLSLYGCGQESEHLECEHSGCYICEKCNHSFIDDFQSYVDTNKNGNGFVHKRK